MPYRAGQAEFGPSPAKLLGHRDKKGAYDVVGHTNGNELRDESRHDDPVTIVDTIRWEVFLQAFFQQVLGGAVVSASYRRDIRRARSLIEESLIVYKEYAHQTEANNITPDPF